MSQTRSEMNDLLAKHGLSPAKRYGQHFLADPNLIRKIVATAGVDRGDDVVEIGVGTGTLTRALAHTGARVVGYEIDRRFEPIHREVLAGIENVEVRYADAAVSDLAEELLGDRWVMVANLPYNVGTTLLLDVLRGVPQVQKMVLMLQDEVARRLAAPPGSKTYGLSSVVAQLHADVRVAFRVPAQVFVPPPKVESAVVVLDRRQAPKGVDPDDAGPGDVDRAIDLAIDLAGRAFRQRRKMIRTSLGLPVDLIELAGLDPDDRAERLAPADYLRLAEVSDG